MILWRLTMLSHMFTDFEWGGPLTASTLRSASRSLSSSPQLSLHLPPCGGGVFLDKAGRFFAFEPLLDLMLRAHVPSSTILSMALASIRGQILRQSCIMTMTREGLLRRPI